MKMKKILAHPLTRIIAAVLLVGVSVYLLSSVYRRVKTPLQLLGRSVTVEGVVTEKRVEKQPDRFLPFDPVAYIVRYAYPNAQGQMRTGEQPVTRAVFNRLDSPGTTTPVTFSLDKPGLSAVDPHLTFPGSSGWRLGIGFCLLTVAVGIFPIKELLALVPGRAEPTDQEDSVAHELVPEDLPLSPSDEPVDLPEEDIISDGGEV